MKAAVVRELGSLPRFEDFADPVASDGEVSVAVSASSLSPLARSRASGMHYSSRGTFPFVAGVDGVGRLDDGSRVYFVLPRAPFGAMAELTVVLAEQCLPIPKKLDDITAAAIANPGMSSWAALIERAKLVTGETVLINGATGTSGQLAVQIAKYLGARKVIACGRNPEALAALTTLGADDLIQLTDDGNALESQFEERFAAGVDIVIDYLWGASAELLLISAAKASPEGKPVRFVQVGTAGGADITLPGAVLRSSAIELMGSGIGSVGLDRLLAAVDGVLGAAAAGALRVESTGVPLRDIEAAWAADTGRCVFIIDR